MGKRVVAGGLGGPCHRHEVMAAHGHELAQARLELTAVTSGSGGWRGLAGALTLEIGTMAREGPEVCGSFPMVHG